MLITLSNVLLTGLRRASIAAALAAALAASGEAVAVPSALSFGANNNASTGLNTNSGWTLVATPINTWNLGGHSIAQVAAGGAHSLLLADDGTAFSFGWNLYGQTGLNTDSGDAFVATPINTWNLGGRSIAQVAAGLDHSLLLADDGTVFSFGNNSNGRTGMNTDSGNTLVATPIDTSNLGGRSIAQVAAGNFHSLLLADDGTVFSFGTNAAGVTGLNTDSGNTLVATPIDTSNLGGRSIAQVAAGLYHSLLLADDGTVFSFGWNGNGATGLNTNSGWTPVATAIDATNLTGPHARAIGISAGGYHSLIIAAPEPTTLPGDFDLDGVVDGHDFLSWQRDTGLGDLADWETHFGQSALTSASTAVPEPNTFLLLLTAACGLAWRRKA